MGVHMSWEWQPDGIAAGDFDTIEDAVEGLDASAHRTYRRYPDHPQRHVMLSCITPLRQRMLSEGAERVAAGQSWVGECGGVHVVLSPSCPGGPHTVA